MESLLCNELWLMLSPTIEHDRRLHANDDEDQVREHHGNPNSSHIHSTFFFYSNMEDCEEAFIVFLGKEAAYTPERDYVNHVQENCLIDSCRFKAIHWFVKSQRRLNLSLETVFIAANYFDRFSSLKRSQVWNGWMFEVLSVACLYAASKFNETNPPSLHQIQMEGLEHSLESTLILWMELNLLEALEWRLSPTTSYSYIQLLLTGSSIDLFNHKVQLVQDFSARVTELLVIALLGSKFLEFRPSVIAASAMHHMSKEFLSTTNDRDSLSINGRLRALFPPDQKDNLIKCHEMMMMMMEEKWVEKCTITYPEKKTNYYSYFSCPPSPATVLASINTPCCCEFCDFYLLKMKSMVDYSYFRGSRSTKKRKRGDGARLAASACGV